MQKAHSWLTPLIVFLTLMIFIIDYFTPLGYADFIFYFIPVALSSLYTKPRNVFWVALYCTAFSVMGFFMSPSGMDRTPAGINRGYGITVIWIVSVLVRQIIANRNKASDQTWVREGQADLNYEIRGELTTSQVASLSLGYICQRTGAIIGALYKEDDQSLVFKRRAGFGVSASLVETFQKGEGLMGQVIHDKKLKVLDDIPEDFIKVETTLGNMKPKQIILLPVFAEGQVNGLVELGFSEKADQRVIDFLESISEHLGVAIRSARYKERLKNLLDETQRQSEELQVQQEELRVTNEELEQQRAALMESQAKLENQQAELEQVNQQLEEQSQQLETQKEALQEKATELERSGKYKSEFLANMSHELRTPLNSSLILAKLLADNKPGNLTPDQINYAKTIMSSGNDLLTLINDILDLSKVEAGKLEIHPVETSITSVLKAMETTFAPLAKDKGITFKFETDRESLIRTDKQRLEQVLRNFISNAIKFTEKGSVTLKVTHETNEMVKFDVIDTGVGIPADQQEIIFEAFHQADGSIGRRHGGTGLGLSISRELTRILGGKITLESVPGKGSTFSIHLPIKWKSETRPVENVYRPPVKDLPESSIPVFKFSDDRKKLKSNSRKIVIIEDDESFAKILLDIAHEMDFEALVAASGKEGLTLAKEHSPQAIMLDVRLPDHHGLAVLDELKADPRTRHIPVHMISSDDYSHEALKMGAATYSLKPVKREEIMSSVSALQGKMQQSLRSVLIVEDDPVQRQGLSLLLQDIAGKITAVGTSADALKKLSAETFDCMVMDLTLPDFSGYELLQKLSEEASPYSFPPVIVYTGRDLDREEEEQIMKYSQSIIIKGAKSPERLVSEVTLFLHQVESELPPEKQKMLKELRNREKTLEGRKILIVDDDARNIFSLTSVLEQQGSDIAVARNGLEALDQLEKEGDVDLVLMDVMMPEMDGHEATIQMRKDPRFKDIPVIMVTARAMKDDQEKCLASGANDYVTKPVDVDKLLSLIRVWMPVISKRKTYK